MSTENSTAEMNVESLKMKIENQQNIMKQLSNENEELYHQFNHLMIRNNKLLKRIDDLQGIIDDLHIRIEELQLINGNMLKLNDKFRIKNDHSINANDHSSNANDNSERLNDKLKIITEFNKVFSKWKNYPSQDAKNEPNLRKQSQMLVHLYHRKELKASELFSKTGVGGVTGARYVATLKKFGLINYIGARKKGHYVMTSKGVEFIESAFNSVDEISQVQQMYSDHDAQPKNFPEPEQKGISVKAEAKDALTSHLNHADL